MRHDAVIFDLDGTLADTLETIAAALNHGLATIGNEPLSLAQVARIVGEGVTTLCEKALTGGRPDALAPLLAATRGHYAANPMYRCRLYPGIAELLDQLAARGVALAVLSNKPHDLTLATVRGLGIEDRFRHVLGHQDEFPRKPDPTSAEFLLRELGVARTRVLYVGDTPIDVATARAASFEVAAVSWGFRSGAELLATHPDHLVHSPHELAAVLGLGTPPHEAGT
jgi:phosphoglycolate phosphatase